MPVQDRDIPIDKPASSKESGDSSASSFANAREGASNASFNDAYNVNQSQSVNYTDALASLSSRNQKVLDSIVPGKALGILDGVPAGRDVPAIKPTVNTAKPGELVPENIRRDNVGNVTVHDRISRDGNTTPDTSNHDLRSFSVGNNLTLSRYPENGTWALRDNRTGTSPQTTTLTLEQQKALNQAIGFNLTYGAGGSIAGNFRLENNALAYTASQSLDQGATRAYEAHRALGTGNTIAGTPAGSPRQFLSARETSTKSNGSQNISQDTILGFNAQGNPVRPGDATTPAAKKDLDISPWDPNAPAAKKNPETSPVPNDKTPLPKNLEKSAEKQSPVKPEVKPGSEAAHFIDGPLLPNGFDRSAITKPTEVAGKPNTIKFGDYQVTSNTDGTITVAGRDGKPIEGRRGSQAFENLQNQLGFQLSLGQDGRIYGALSFANDKLTYEARHTIPENPSLTGRFGGGDRNIRTVVTYNSDGRMNSMNLQNMDNFSHVQVNSQGDKTRWLWDGFAHTGTGHPQGFRRLGDSDIKQNQDGSWEIAFKDGLRGVDERGQPYAQRIVLRNHGNLAEFDYGNQVAHRRFETGQQGQPGYHYITQNGQITQASVNLGTSHEGSNARWVQGGAFDPARQGPVNRNSALGGELWTKLNPTNSLYYDQGGKRYAIDVNSGQQYELGQAPAPRPGDRDDRNPPGPGADVPTQPSGKPDIKPPRNPIDKPPIITEANFNREVIAASKTQPVLVMVTTPTCVHCKPMYKPVADLQNNNPRRLSVGNINAADQANANLAGPDGRLNVDSYPTVILFNGGREVGRLTGSQTPEQLREFVRPYLSQNPVAPVQPFQPRRQANPVTPAYNPYPIVPRSGSSCGPNGCT